MSATDANSNANDQLMSSETSGLSADDTQLDEMQPRPVEPEQMQKQVVAAKQASKPLRRAQSVAAMSAWSLAIFSGLSLLFSGLSVSGIAVAAVLAALSWSEFKGLKQLKAFDRQGPLTLGLNQYGLLMLIVVYCGLQAYAAYSGQMVDRLLEHVQKAASQDPMAAEVLEEILAPVREVLSPILALAYGVAGVLGGIWQLIMAGYYRRVSEKLAAFLDVTPSWVLKVLR